MFPCLITIIVFWTVSWGHSLVLSHNLHCESFSEGFVLVRRSRREVVHFQVSLGVMANLCSAEPQLSLSLSSTWVILTNRWVEEASGHASLLHCHNTVSWKPPPLHLLPPLSHHALFTPVSTLASSALYLAFPVLYPSLHLGANDNVAVSQLVYLIVPLMQQENIHEILVFNNRKISWHCCSERWAYPNPEDCTQ